MLNFLSGFLGALIGALATFYACVTSSRTQQHSDRINHLSLSLSDFFTAFSVYQGDPTEANYFVLVSTVERVRLFCLESLLPAVDAFRSKVLNRSTPQEELGRAYRVIASLARQEVNAPEKRRNRRQ